MGGVGCSSVTYVWKSKFLNMRVKLVCIWTMSKRLLLLLFFSGLYFNFRSLFLDTTLLALQGRLIIHLLYRA